MPEPRPLNLAASYLSLAAAQLLADESAAALFAAVECLEIHSQLCEFGPDAAAAVAVVPPTEALTLAGELLNADGDAELVVLGLRLLRLARAVG